MLKISDSAYASLRQHGEETYPYECCGVLLGRFEDDGTKTVTRVVRCGNTATTRRKIATTLDPQGTHPHPAREGRERAEDVVGFYHSHPSHPAQWSKTDLEEAHWIGCSYVITSVEKGQAVATNSFELAGSDEADKKLADEELEVG